MVLGLAIFAIGASRARSGTLSMVRTSLWVPVWLGGILVIGALGGYGDSAHNVIPAFVDLAVVSAFSLAVFYWAVSLRLTSDDAKTEIAKDTYQLADLDAL